MVSSAASARRLIAPLRAELLELLQGLVRTNSVAIPPEGCESEAQMVLQRFLEKYEVPAELYAVDFVSASGHRLARRERNYQGRRNLRAQIAGSGMGRSLLLNGHMDTVPPGQIHWTASPWSGHLDKGRVYGLGSFDMKGGLVAQAGVMCALRNSGARFGGDILFESVVDEEWGGGGGSLGARLRGDTADACIICEGTQLQVLRATRGGFVVDLVLHAGDPASYFSNAEVVSPALHVGRLLGWVEQWRRRRAAIAPSGAYSEFSDPTPLQVLAIEANRLDRDVPLSVPNTATIRLYFQFLPEEDVHKILGEIQESLRDFEREDSFFRAHPVHWLPLYDPPLLGHQVPIDHPLVTTMSSAGEAVIGKCPVITGAPYPCDAFIMNREFNIPTLLFGPCGGGAHNPDEHVEFESVLRTAEVLLTLALEWCNG